MPSLHEIKSQIQSLSGLEGFLGRREINELPNILWPSETILGIIQGTYNSGSGILVATNRRLIFIDKGLLYGLKVEDFSYDKISSIKYQTGLMMGELTILASGNNAVIKNVYNGKLRYFAETVRMIMSGELRSSSHHGQPRHKEPEPVDVDFEMEKIETHRELGIITEAEFEDTRRQLLGDQKSHQQGSIDNGVLFKWCVGSFAVIIGLYSEYWALSILYIGLGIFILPPIHSRIQIKRYLKYLIVIAGVILIGLSHGIINKLEQKRLEEAALNQREQELTLAAWADSLLVHAHQMIAIGNYDSANYFISEAKRGYQFPENRATKLESQLTNFTSEDFFKNTLVGLTRGEYANLTTTPKRFFSNDDLNKRFITKLLAGRKTWETAIKEKEAQLLVEKRALEKAAKDAEIKKEKERIAAEKRSAGKRVATSQKWYQGGNLHDASINEWKKASNRNKLATCADYALLLHPNFDDVDELKPYALAISVCIDEGTVDDLEMFKDITVKEAASMCILLIQNESRN